MAQGWGLIVNWKKSGLMFLSNKRNYAHLVSRIQNNDLKDASKCNPGVIIESKEKHKLVYRMLNPIPVVETYRYLGVDLNGKMTFRNALSFLKKKLNFLSYALSPIKSQGPNLRFDQNLWNTFARPLIDYYAPFAWKLGSKAFDSLINLSRTSLRSFLGLAQGTPRVIVDCLMLYNIEEWGSRSVSRWESQYQSYIDGNLVQVSSGITTKPLYDMTLMSKTWLHVSNVFFSRIKCELCGNSRDTSSRLDSKHLQMHFPYCHVTDIAALLREGLEVSREVQECSVKIGLLLSLDVDFENEGVSIKALIEERRSALSRWQGLNQQLNHIYSLMNICLFRKI